MIIDKDSVLIIGDPTALIEVSGASLADVPIYVPDVVYWESHRVSEVTETRKWINTCDHVQMYHTEIMIDYRHRLSERRQTHDLLAMALWETLLSTSSSSRVLIVFSSTVLGRFTKIGARTRMIEISELIKCDS